MCELCIEYSFNGLIFESLRKGRTFIWVVNKFKFKMSLKLKNVTLKFYFLKRQSPHSPTLHMTSSRTSMYYFLLNVFYDSLLNCKLITITKIYMSSYNQHRFIKYIYSIVYKPALRVPREGFFYFQWRKAIRKDP